MSVFKRGNIWWYRFQWNGEEVRESSKVTNRRTAEKMESAHKNRLALGEVGIREKVRVPTLKEFAERDFRPFIRQHCADKPRTLTYYEGGLASLLAVPALANAPMDAIRQEQITAFVSGLREKGFEVSSMNRKLEVLRRMFKLAMEWEKVEKVLPIVRMLPGEKRRERVLTGEEQSGYLAAAVAIGDDALAAYAKAQTGIRATMRGETPIPPRDPYMLRDAAVLLLECALRPEECHRLRWAELSEGTLRIAHGKTDNARRVIPLNERAASVLEMRRTVAGDSEWVFPAPTRSGHIEQFSIKKQHTAACEMAEVSHFPIYTFRHTCLTRWASVMDPYTLAYLAGHSDFSTTKRYVHPQKEQVLEAMRRAHEAQTPHNIRHTEKQETGEPNHQTPAIN